MLFSSFTLLKKSEKDVPEAQTTVQTTWILTKHARKIWSEFRTKSCFWRVICVLLVKISIDNTPKKVTTGEKSKSKITKLESGTRLLDLAGQYCMEVDRIDLTEQQRSQQQSSLEIIILIYIIFYKIQLESRTALQNRLCSTSRVHCN